MNNLQLVEELHTPDGKGNTIREENFQQLAH